MRVLIVGAGGHGQVVADILWRMKDAGGALTPIGFLDDDVSLHGKVISNVLVLGQMADLSLFPHEAVIIGIGNNRFRQQIAHSFQAQSEQFVIARHPTAVIASDVSIGPGTVICANAVVNPGSVIGSHVILNTACTVDHHNHIGDYVHIAPGVHLGGDVQIGASSLVGIGAIIVPQKQIGNGCTIGAGTVVHRDLPDGVTAVGVPARIIKYAKHGN